MKIMYGVVGEGMGHATRSRVVLRHLLGQGHELFVVVSGRAYGFLKEVFKGESRIQFQEIVGLHLVYDGEGIDTRRSIRSNLTQSPRSLSTNMEAYQKVAQDFQPEMVFSDFESWTYFFAKAFELPVVSIDNMQIINRCEHSSEVTQQRCPNFRLSKVAVKAKLPKAYYYLVTSFFYPRVRKKRTSLLPPILRPEILAAEREPGEHILVYQSADANKALLPLLKTLPYEFRVYGMGEEGQDANITLRPFSQQGFIDDLRTAKGAIAGGGYSLMGEAVHLKVPMLSVPLKGQYEQVLNAKYLEALGYGAFASSLTAQSVTDFLARLGSFNEALAGYIPRDNQMLLGCVDELVSRVSMGERRPLVLDSPDLGNWVSGRTEKALEA